MRPKLYRSIEVWVRISDDRVAVYRCFELLSSGGFCVQSKDFFSLPLLRTALHNSAEQLVELFAESDPEKRAGRFSTLEAAIEAHDRKFPD